MGVLPLYLSVLCALWCFCYTMAVWGKVGLCRWLLSPGQAEWCAWKLAEPHAALRHRSWWHYIIPAGTGRCLDAGKGGGQGIKHESRSATRAARQGGNASQAVGSWLHDEPGSSSERMLWMWGYPAQTQNWAFVSLGNREKTRHPSGSKVLLRSDIQRGAC